MTIQFLRRTGGIAAFFAVVFGLLSCVHAERYSRAAGRPNNLEGSREGFYVWTEGDTVHVAYNRARGRRISGTVTSTGGTFRNLRGFNEQHDNRFNNTGARRIGFRFKANDRNDGIKFEWNGGGDLTFDLNASSGSEDIFLGRNKNRVDGSRVTLERGRDQDDDFGPIGGGGNGQGNGNFPGIGNGNDGYDDGRYDNDYGQPGEGTWGDISGRPQDLERARGFYVWREGNTVHIAYSRRGFGAGRVAGSIRVENGSISNARGFGNENDRRFTLKSSDRLHFLIERGESVDGIKFDISSLNSRMFIRTRLGGREQTYYLGSGKRKVQDNALLIKP